MPGNRSLDRNVHFYDASNPDVALGGLIQNGSVTEANFLDMIGILVITETPLRIQERASGHVVATTNNPLQPGDYDVYCDSQIEINNEPWVHRLITHSISGCEQAFRDGIRARDGRCVISGVVNIRARSNGWSGFQAAHIFPLESESYWVEANYGRWIRDVTPGVAKINSRQNGLLLRGDIHTDFDKYLVSVNPNDNHKIVVFGLDVFGVDGRTLDPICRDPANPHRVSDQLLRWHFRQSVLANMRGAGEPLFEHDFPPGTDRIVFVTGRGRGPDGEDRARHEKNVEKDFSEA